MPKAFKSCQKCKKSPNLVTLITNSIWNLYSTYWRVIFHIIYAFIPRLLIYFTRVSIIVWLTSCLTGLDSDAFAYVESKADLLVWSNKSNRRSAVQWYLPLQSKWGLTASIKYLRPAKTLAGDQLEQELFSCPWSSRPQKMKNRTTTSRWRNLKNIIFKII